MGASGRAYGRGDRREYYLERLPLATPYPEVVGRIVRVTDQVRARMGKADGVRGRDRGGQLVVDLLRERVKSGAVVLVTFTAGDRRAERWNGGRLWVTLGKGFKVSQLQVLIGTGRLHLPRTREAAELTGELLNYELRVGANGHARAALLAWGRMTTWPARSASAVQIDPD